MPLCGARISIGKPRPAAQRRAFKRSVLHAEFVFSRVDKETKITGNFSDLFGDQLVGRSHAEGIFDPNFTLKAETITWEVRCPVHGLHYVSQKTEPLICKIKVQLSPRYVRQCRKRLMSPVQVRT